MPWREKRDDQRVEAGDGNGGGAVTGSDTVQGKPWAWLLMFGWREDKVFGSEQVELTGQISGWCMSSGEKKRVG